MLHGGEAWFHLGRRMAMEPERESKKQRPRNMEKHEVLVRWQVVNCDKICNSQYHSMPPCLLSREVFCCNVRHLLHTCLIG